jgi:transcriptional regulator with XRE-family HTH domain
MNMMENQTEQNMPYPTDQLAAGLVKAREYRQLSRNSCSQLLGIPVGRLRNYEEGKYVPTLPEIEGLAYIYGLPLTALFDPREIDHLINEPDADNLQQLIRIRGHIISTRLQIAFDQSGKTLREITKETGLSASRIRKYLNNALEMSYDDLCVLSGVLGMDTHSQFDTDSSIGRWQAMQSRMARFCRLPEDIQEYVIAEDKTELLRVAHRLMDLDLQSLRTLSDSLQTIMDLQENPEDAQRES